MREDIAALGERIAEQCVHLDAAMHRLLVDLHEFDKAGGWYQQGFQSCAHWLSWRVGWDLSTARDRVRVASRLPALPKVTEKLASGELSYSKARAIARVATPETEEALLVHAEFLPAAQLERVCGKLHTVQEIRKACEEGRPRERHERNVQVLPLEDGMACVKAVLTAEEAALLMNVVEEAARGVQEPVPADAAKTMVRPSKRLPRADGLMTVIQGHARGNSQERTPIDLLITVPVAALRSDGAIAGEETSDSAECETGERGSGDSAESGRCGCGDEVADAGLPAIADADCVGELPDGGSLSPQTVRRLACDAGLVEVQVDGQGPPLSIGRKTRAIPAAIKRALVIRDRTCRFPGCSNRLFLDGHHIRHWADGGETSLANTCLLCSHHHRCVHEQGYQIILGEHGQPLFLDPRGREVIAAPARPTPLDAGWPGIRAANEELELDARTGACKWKGEQVNYSYAIDVILGAERRARREAAEREAAEREAGETGEADRTGTS